MISSRDARIRTTVLPDGAAPSRGSIRIPSSRIPAAAVPMRSVAGVRLPDDPATIGSAPLVCALITAGLGARPVIVASTAIQVHLLRTGRHSANRAYAGQIPSDRDVDMP